MAEFCLDCMNRIDRAHYTRAVVGFRDPHGLPLWRLLFRK